jgi:hypothetical protein
VVLGEECVVMGGRDHSVECDDCGAMKGGINDLKCSCDTTGCQCNAWSSNECACGAWHVDGDERDCLRLIKASLDTQGGGIGMSDYDAVRRVAAVVADLDSADRFQMAVRTSLKARGMFVCRKCGDVGQFRDAGMMLDCNPPIAYCKRCK